MEFAVYSISLILGFAATRWVTENIKFHVRNKKIWLHHWIVATIVMCALFYFKIDYVFVWGALTEWPSRDCLVKIGQFVGDFSINPQ